MEKNIILHDYFAIKGGGERLVLTLASNLGWPLQTAFHNKKSYDRRDWPDVQIETFGIRPANPAIQIPKLMLTWQRFKIPGQRSAALYSGSYAPLAVGGVRAGRHVMYCHSPPRFVYDQRDYAFSLLQAWQRPLLKAMIRYFRPRYEAAVARMDTLVANSENVRRRIARYLQRDAVVVHPPCDTRRFQWLGQGDYYLSTARLDPFKRVEQVVKAFARMPEKRLIVTSGGPQLAYLQRIARNANNITFTGWVAESKLRELMGNAVATIYVPRDEDFGMSPVESMAAGKPVICVAEGGLLETVLDGKTGLLIRPNITPEHIAEAVQTLTPDRALDMREACEKRARMFCTERFLREMRKVLDVN